jgi:hypothetical protein
LANGWLASRFLGWLGSWAIYAILREANQVGIRNGAK